MALTKKEKWKLVDSYKSNIEGAKSVVVLKQFWIPVNDINSVRMALAEVGGKIQIVKKRIFLSTMQQSGFEWWQLDELEGSAVILYSYQDEFAPLKVIAKFIKAWKKQDKKYAFDYSWGWFGNSWKDKNYTSELANLPSKEELVWKLAFLFNYPLTSFARALNEIAKKNEWN